MLGPDQVTCPLAPCGVSVPAGHWSQRDAPDALWKKPVGHSVGLREPFTGTK